MGKLKKKINVILVDDNKNNLKALCFIFEILRENY
jgi:hypothetical protein